jgi:putative glutamine amidotransferase
MSPLIGITQCLDDQERWREGRRYLYLDYAYAQAVERAGGTPVMLPIQADAAGLADRLDGLLLPGGDDFLPEIPYAESVAFAPAATTQVDFARALLGAALARRMPVLGICYGAQLMALQHGGRLHHHIPIDVPQSAHHQLDENEGRHPVEIVAGSLLERLVGDRAASVNSLHHQAIAEPGADLRVSARAPDGIIEAVESVDEAAFVLGVQWHPEKLSGSAGAGLLAALVAASARR